MYRQRIERIGGDGYGRAIRMGGFKQVDVSAYRIVAGCTEERQAVKGLLESGVTGDEIQKRRRFGFTTSRMDAAIQVLKEHLSPQA